MLFWIICLLRTRFIFLISLFSSPYRQRNCWKLWGEWSQDLHSCCTWILQLIRTPWELPFTNFRALNFIFTVCFMVSPAMNSSKLWGIFPFLSWLNPCFILLSLAKRGCKSVQRCFLSFVVGGVSSRFSPLNGLRAVQPQCSTFCYLTVDSHSLSLYFLISTWQESTRNEIYIFFILKQHLNFSWFSQ